MENTTTTSSMNSAQAPHPITKSYHDASAIFGSHFLKFMGVSLVPGVIVYILTMALKVSIISSLTHITSLGDLFSPEYVSSFLTLFLIAAIILVQTIGIIALIYMVVKHETASILHAFEHALGYFFRFIIVGICVALISLVGLVVGFIPVVIAGIIAGSISIELLNTTFEWLALIAPMVSSIFSTFFIFAPYILVEKNCSVSVALHESRRLVRGHFWETAIRLLIFYSAITIVTLALQYIPVVGRLIALLIITPFTVVYLFTLYQHLSAVKR